MAGLRYRAILPVRSTYWCNIPGIYIDRKSLQYTSVLPTANIANIWGSIALLILEVYHRVQINEYDAVLMYRQLVLHYT